MSKNLLIVCNTPSPNTRALAEASVEGANHDEITNVAVVFKQPLEAVAEDVLNADGILVGTTENFGYMSGLIKDFFERIYYPCLEKTQGKPCAVYIRAGLDGTGTQVAIEKIITGLRWKSVQPALILKGDHQPDFVRQTRELGQTIAAGLDADIF
ncbi:MAG: NAD(P)H-dependent oxidoreductase [Gammaproteobacteria bacterium]|nr:NAD(P)H-dependent oxidoreductase [Gammaproteobacteria bacterium]